MGQTFVWKNALSIQRPLPQPQQNPKPQPQPNTIGLKPQQLITIGQQKQQLPTQPQHIWIGLQQQKSQPLSMDVDLHNGLMINGVMMTIIMQVVTLMMELVVTISLMDGTHIAK